MSRFPLFFAALLVSFGVVRAEEPAANALPPVNDYEARTFRSEAGKTLGYRLLKPKDYDPARKYPLVLFLHGAGQRGDDNTAQVKYGVPPFAKPAFRGQFPCFVVVPQCPAEQKWVDLDWAATGPHTQPAALTQSTELALGAVAAVQKEFSIDVDRLYVMGLSMGGYGTWDLITRQPEKWAAAVAICGGGDRTVAARAKGVAVWAFHGLNDGVIKPSRTVEMIEALRAAGANPLYSELPYTGHNCWDIAFGEPQLLPWLFAQKRGQAAVPFEKVAGPLEQPPSNQCPGAGPMQPGIWFRDLWRTRRTAWDKAKEADQGAVVFFGDSITQGWETLAQDFPGLKTANRGISGDTTRGLLVRVQGDVLDLKPRAVSLLIGTNDLDQGAEPELVLGNVKSLIAMLHAADPKLPVVINKVMPRGLQPKRYPDKIVKLNALYEEAFAKDPLVTFCDTFTLFNDGTGSVSKEEFPDLLHPNALGYARWKGALMPIFEKLGLAK